MENFMIDSLVEIVEKYDAQAGEMIYRAYEYAFRVHGNQRRKSGELYIQHPLEVALILAELSADCDTVCAGLLHDVIEDGQGISRKDLEKEFNSVIAMLTDGVTKMPRYLFSSKEDQNDANYRKLIMGVVVDPRIILLKLADRLHNMRTLMYLPRNKQIENAIETLELYVPLANYYGFQKMKNELEDLAFQYLNYDLYQFIQEQRQDIIDNDCILKGMANSLQNDLIKNEIQNQVSYRFKRSYAIYQQLTNKMISPSELVHLQKEDLPLSKMGLQHIHDFRSLKILVSSLKKCYLSSEYLMQHFLIMEGKQKDCIKHPKTNGYQSLHTTIYGSDGNMIQTQIRTHEMDRFASLGLASYWEKYGDVANKKMKKDLQVKCPFYHSLLELNHVFSKNEDFVRKTKEEVLSNMIYPCTLDGKVIELPFGSTPVDFALKANYDMDCNDIIAFVNGRPVPLNYPLSNKAIVEIVPTLKRYVMGSLSSYAVTTYAKTRIKSRSER